MKKIFKDIHLLELFSDIFKSKSSLTRVATGMACLSAVLHVSIFVVADWKYRHAGLMALSAIGEGCHQQMEGILNEIVNFVLLFLQDPVSISRCLIYSYCPSFTWSPMP